MNRRQFIIDGATASKTLMDGIIADANAWPDEPPVIVAPTPWPTSLDCLGGTPSSLITIPAGDGAPTGQLPEPIYTRKTNTMPGGTVCILGDSILQMMHENRMHKAAYNFALGGQSLRRLINSLLVSPLGGANGFMRHTGAFVIMCGVNDLGNTTYYGPWTNNQAAQTVWISMYGGKLKPWLTGKGVICHLLPVDQVVTGAAGYNAQISAINAQLHDGAGGALNGCAAQLKFIPVDPDWVDASGNLKDEYHIDGQHPSAAFCRIYEDRIAQALSELGV